VAAEEKPSHYIRNNVWFASQPVEEPERPKFHDYILEMMHADEMLIYASDYPHWDGDDPVGAATDGRRHGASDQTRERGRAVGPPDGRKQTEVIPMTKNDSRSVRLPNSTPASGESSTSTDFRSAFSTSTGSTTR